MIIMGYIIFSIKTYVVGSTEVRQRGASNEYPQCMFYGEIRKKYSRIITKYSSLTIPLTEPTRYILVQKLFLIITIITYLPKRMNRF